MHLTLSDGTMDSINDAEVATTGGSGKLRLSRVGGDHPNGVCNFALLPSVPPPAPKRAAQASWNNPAPPSLHHGSLGPRGQEEEV
ncbi:hypothetical protein B9Z19DRAFT_545424 [Tuber borchii]|uniref:Uncharacterized protein n=1 Tax=Tuber borchii TaxID=42251 RepID=A0A2T6ZD02_TUBBO|nr:hypothetical protein B9Z19DRAFT_545424 [Tuber borchii]